MASFAPPAGPPPPSVPDGWKAVWNSQYNEWFYVNLQTKVSQWDKPTRSAYETDDEPPPGGPPGYDHSTSINTGPEKGSFANNSAPAAGVASGSHVDTDEDYARRLQAEEDARATTRGHSDSYYNGSQQSQTSPQSQQLPPREEKKKGLFSKIGSKLGGGSSSQRYNQYPAYPPQQGYGPPQGYGYGGPGPGYGGGYPQYGGYGPPPGGYYQQPYRRQGGGMGAGGGAALGVGAGLLGGMLIADSMNDSYDQGYDDGGGGDMGGGDDGGGGGD